jgi:hypothetical protein
MEDPASNLAAYHDRVQMNSRILPMIQGEVNRHRCSMLAAFHSLI